MNKHIRRIFYILILQSILLSSCMKTANISKEESNQDSEYFDIEFHRGGRDSRPENTLYSYLFSIEEGATTIECDMLVTKDDQIVMCHEPFFEHDITRDKNGRFLDDDDDLDIRLMTVDEIKEYDVGLAKVGSEYYEAHGKTQKTTGSAKIPTIDELFMLVKECNSDIKINMETKIYYDVDSEPRARVYTDPEHFVKLFNDKIKEYEMEDQVTLQSFDWNTLVIMEKVNSKIKTIALFNEQPSWGENERYLRRYDDGASPYLAGLDIDDFKGDAVLAAHSLGIDAVSPYIKEVTIDMVEEAHNLGMEIIPWNANTKEQIETMYYMGVDGIISDKGELLYDTIKAHNVKLRPKRKISESEYHID